jgi:ankyrin repeat protein
MADTERLAKQQAELMGTATVDTGAVAEAEADSEKAKAAWQHKALLFVKNGKLAELEEALDEDVPVDTADEHGNTLLILACQQGNKRLAKFLLRRGAKMNAQSLNGNTILHYCYFYNFEELAEYLKAHGADDSLLNSDGLTCYEGINATVVDQM